MLYRYIPLVALSFFLTGSVITATPPSDIINYKTANVPKDEKSPSPEAAAPESEAAVTAPEAAAPTPEPAVPESENIEPATEAAVSDTVSLQGVAVSTFVGRGVDSLFALGFSDRFRMHFLQICPFTVMEPLQMDRILDSRGFNQGYLCDHNDCLIDMGRQLGVRYIITGSVGKITNIYSIAVRMIDVQTGKVIDFELKDTRLPIEEILTVTLGQLAKEFNDKLIRSTSATVDIQSKPNGAQVLLNGKTAGLTPLLLLNLEEGKCVISLQLKNYREITDSLLLAKGKQVSRMYNLQMTDEYAGIVKGKKSLMEKRIVQGIGAFSSIAAIGVGVYYNNKLEDVAATQRRIIDEYNAGGVGTDFATLKKRYEKQSELFDHWKLYRNIGYIFGPILAAGVTVCFFF